jgi:hypothetical protein
MYVSQSFAAFIPQVCNPFPLGRLNAFQSCLIVGAYEATFEFLLKKHTSRSFSPITHLSCLYLEVPKSSKYIPTLEVLYFSGMSLV